MIKSRMIKSQGQEEGYGLIEMLIVLVIAGILLGILYPSYSDHLYETRRSDATIALTSAAAAQERWYTVNSSFSDDMDNLGGSDSAEQFYTLSVAATDSTYTLTATARSNSPQSGDSGCTSLTLDHLGRQLPADCWK